jgi:uncharacterized protein (DUF1015 family)
MAKITPFRGLRPRKELAANVATLPYDVCSVEEARRFKDAPYNFYHITRSEIDLPFDIDVHSPLVYERAAENLDNFIKDGVLFQDAEPCYYIYQLVMDGRSQTGLVCGSAIDDYESGVIKKHELTRPEKELDRINHMKATRAQTGVVFLAYRDVAAIHNIIEDWKTQHAPIYDFQSEDGVQHRLWVISDYGKISNITNIFEDEVPATYIADGHHRAASAAKVAGEFKKHGLNISGTESFNYMLTCIFPESEVQIMDYNRVVKDLNGLTPEAFLHKLSVDFTITKIGAEAYGPQAFHDFGLYLDGLWYKLEAREDSFANDPIGILDVQILQQNILSKILGIHDPRTDRRVDFVGGIRGLKELERRVNSGDMAAAFSCFPVSLKQLFEVADSGEVMPPKSTWFEPKTRDGLVTHLF